MVLKNILNIVEFIIKNEDTFSPFVTECSRLTCGNRYSIFLAICLSLLEKVSSLCFFLNFLSRLSGRKQGELRRLRPDGGAKKRGKTLRGDKFVIRPLHNFVFGA